jgi:hypothetical protein
MAALLVLAGGACSDRATAPEIGTLRVTVRSTGGDLDLDGYALIVDSKPRQQQVFVNTSMRLAAGRHSVALAGVAENCAVSGSRQRSVTVTPEQVADVEYDVVCVATGIAVTTRTTGVAIPDAYQLILNDRRWGIVNPTDSTVVGRLAPGAFTVAVTLAGDRCTAGAPNPVAVDVSPRALTVVRFDITCVAPKEKSPSSWIRPSTACSSYGSASSIPTARAQGRSRQATHRRGRRTAPSSCSRPPIATSTASVVPVDSL